MTRGLPRLPLTMPRRLLAVIGHDDTHPSAGQPATVETRKKEVVENTFPGLKYPQGLAVVPIRRLPFVTK
jgi:hypothetical protein